jgi:sec-independent protein translocase protein TatA
MTPVFALFQLSPAEIIVLLGLGVLLFGRKLPEVGRYLGKGIVEFKKGMKGLEDEIVDSSAARTTEAPALEQPRPPQRIMTTAPKFSDTFSPPEAPPKV